ncbi:MAG: hypothetical protein QW416_06155 [Candidatus Nitrosocaldaceae archaeon]
MEIWFNYGDSEIALDIKAENILERIEHKKVDSQISIEVFDSINVNHLNMYILDDRKIIEDLATKIKERLERKGITTNIFTSSSSFDDNIYNRKDTLLISGASFDPLFGYSGVVSNIARKNKDFMKYIIQDNVEPSPGSITNLSMAYENVRSFECKSLEVIIDNDSIIDFVIDEPIKASQYMINKLNAFRIKCERCKSIIIGSGRTSTLHHSLTSLWNCINVLREGGDAILLTESSNGLGSTALQIYLNRGKIDGYIRGIEDILFIKWARDRYNISLVTSLPDYYLKILGFTPFRSINYALKSILEKNPRQKITLVQDASNIMLERLE